MFRMFIILIVVFAQTSLSFADVWKREPLSAGGHRVTFYKAGFGIEILCHTGNGVTNPNRIKLIVGQDSPLGPVVLETGKDRMTIRFDDNGHLYAKNELYTRLFNRLVELLKTGSSLLITDPEGNEESVTLSGSSGAIGECKAFFSDAPFELETKISDKPYDQARKMILNEGWGVVKNPAPDELVFVSRSMYEQGFIEVELCAPTGRTPCSFYFKRNENEFLRVMTIGEEPHVSAVQVLDADGYKELRPVFED